MEVDIRRQINILSNNEKYEKENQHEVRFTLSDILPISRYAKTMATSNLKTSSAPKSQPIFTIEVIKEDDADEVLKLLKTFFFKDEPLNTYLNLGECRELEEYSVKSIPDGCSFKAVNQQGEIIGVFLCSVLERPPKDYVPEKSSETCEHQKFKKVLGFLEHVELQFDIFDYYPEINKIIDGKILSVNDQYRGLGIAGHLTNRVIQYMKDHNIPVFHVICTSEFSARVMEKLDFEIVFTLPFADYLNEHGEIVLNPAKPHVACKILAKKID